MKFLFVCGLLAFSTCCFAQEGSYRHVVSVQYSNISHMAGSGPFVGYDYLFGHSRYGFWNAGAEFGGQGFFLDGYHEYSFRASAGYNLGKRMHFLRLGIGAAYYDGYTDNRTPPENRWNERYGGPLIGYSFIGKRRLQFGSSAGIYMGTGTRNYYPVTASLGLGFGKR